jgi:hypothetical protein
LGPGDFTGATAGDAGTNGLVPAPAAGDQAKFLQGDGTWANPTTATAWGNITGTLSDQTDLQSALNAKQDTITGAATTITSNNLTANRAVISNASGKVAVSTTTSTELGYVHGVTSAVQTQLNGKQATLVSGTNIKTVNNNSLLGSGNIDIDALPSQTGHAGEFLTTDGTTASWAPGQADIDNSTITKNASDELQAVATINANTAAGATNPVYDWVGTLAEHQAQNIETLHPDWICYITDDINGGTSVYTKSEVDTLLASKANTATTLAGYGITDGVAKGHELIAYQAPTSSNNYIWYRKYADGWVEQGCHYVNQGTAWTFPIPMANDLYTLVASYVDSSSTNTPQWVYMGIQQYSTYVTPKANGPAQRIYICGKAAS